MGEQSLDQIYMRDDMGEKSELDPSVINAGRLRGASYMTQMLLELGLLARERDVELTYFIEMAVTISAGLDLKERLARRTSHGST